MAKGQAERLLGLLGEVLAEAGAGWRDLSAIGVGTGPGNFTGIRLSVAAARGLSLGLGIPAIGVSSLEAAAHGLSPPVLVALDARRGEVYLQFFDRAGGAGAVLAAAGTLPAWAFAATRVTGDAASSVAALLPGAAVVAPRDPVAVAVARIAATRWATAQPRPAPVYLRLADAMPPRAPVPEALS